MDEIFHGLGDFVVQDVFVWLDAGMVEVAHEGGVSAGELGIFAVLDGFNEYGAAVNFDHDHDALMACLGASGELACLVGEDGVSGVINFGVDVALFFATELFRVNGRFNLVEQTFLRVWLMCPLGVSVVSG